MGVSFLNCRTCNSVHHSDSLIQCQTCGESQFCIDCIDESFHDAKYDKERDGYILNCCDYCCELGHDKIPSYSEKIRLKALKEQEDYKTKYENLLKQFEELKLKMDKPKRKRTVKPKNI